MRFNKERSLSTRRILRLGHICGPVLIFVIAYLFLRRFAYLDPDFFHDGFMLASAIAVHDGLTVHRDVFQFYGPFVSWVQGSLVWGDGPTIHSLRTANLILAASIAALMAATSFAIGWKAAYASALFWMLLADVGWSDEDSEMIPMPPLLVVFLVILSMNAGLLLFKRTESRDLTTRAAKEESNWIAFCTGVPLGLAIHTRLNVAIPAFLVTLIVLTYLSAFHRRYWVELLLLGFVVPNIFILSFLAMTGSLSDWWTQVIEFPTTYHSGLIYGNWVAPFLRGERTLVPFVILLMGLMTFFAARRIKPLQELWKRFLRGNSSLTALVLAIVVLSVLIIYVFQSVTSPISIEGASHGMRFIIWISLAVIVLIIFRALTKSTQSVMSKKLSIYELKMAYLALLAVSCLALLLPWLGPRYVWWAMPIGLLFLGQVFFSNTYLGSTKTNITVSLVLATTCVLGYIASLDITSKERVPGPADTVFEGMFMSDQAHDRVSQIARITSSLPEGSRVGVFDCADGVFSVLHGRYESSSKYFLNEGAWFESAPSIKTTLRAEINRTPPLIFTCNLEQSLARTPQLNTAIESRVYEVQDLGEGMFLLFKPTARVSQ